VPYGLQVAREGTKKTVFTNFPELCRSMNRGQEHVMAFLLAELGTRCGIWSLSLQRMSLCKVDAGLLHSRPT